MNEQHTTQQDTTTKEQTMTEQTPTTFPDFHTWLNNDKDRTRDYEYTATRNAGSRGMTAEVSKIIRTHAQDCAYEYTQNVDAEDVSDRTIDNFMSDYQFDTSDGPTRAALVHWAWNSDLDLTEFGPLSGDNIWEQIEHLTWYAIDSATRQALEEFADLYTEDRQDWINEQEDICTWTYTGQDDTLHWWHCEVHDYDAMGGKTEEPEFPCEGWLNNNTEETTK